MKSTENKNVKRNTSHLLSLEGEGGTQYQVRGKVNKANLIYTPSSTLRAFSPSRGKQTPNGFTLIELLVVILIIGILAAVAVPQYQKAVAKSRYAKLKPLVKALAEAEEVYYLANGKYTIDVDDLDINLPSFPIEIENAENGTGYTFSWGYCTLDDEKKHGSRITCEDSLAGVKYARML